jgi:hypothetical protein
MPHSPHSSPRRPIVPIVPSRADPRSEPVPKQLEASSAGEKIEKVSFVDDEAKFRWELFQDAMAFDKLHEGIRGFAKDGEYLLHPTRSSLLHPSYSRPCHPCMALSPRVQFVSRADSTQAKPSRTCSRRSSRPKRIGAGLARFRYVSDAPARCSVSWDEAEKRISRVGAG